MSANESMSFTEAKAIFVQQIRKQTATGLLIDALDRAEQAQTLLGELEEKKIAMRKEIADMEPQRAAAIAEAKDAAEKEGRKLAAEYAAHAATARGQVEQMQTEMQKNNAAQAAQRVEIDRLKVEVAAQRDVLATWRSRIDDVQRQHTKKVEEMGQLEDAQTERRAQWAAEKEAAQEEVKAVKRELAAVVAKFQGA